jgi:para-nitrobenzyl esterase
MRALGLMLLVAVAASVTAPAQAVERLVTGGAIRGEELADGSTVFRAIPYAAPPVGDLRWKPPQPVEPWEGVRDVTKAPPPCFQHDEGWNTADAKASQEDCLYLGVHAPKHKATDRMPVMFWIHGGSNRAGSGSGYIDSVIHTHGVVLVSIEYRLGVFGFLASPELSAEQPNHISGNYALLDQIAALKWVKDNIARFGGDANNVTIAGQSAGAYDVSVLMLSPLARGLFAKAIAESGASGLAVPSRRQAAMEDIGTDFSTLMKVPAGAQGLQALRAAAPDAVLKASDALRPPFTDPSSVWGQAALDGYVLPGTPADLLAHKAQALVPLIVGNNTREFALDAPLDVQRGFIAAVFGDNATKALSLYGLSGTDKPVDDPVLGSVGMQILTDAIFRCPASQWATLQSRAGQKVWRYQFGLGRARTSGPSEHSAELGYVFDALPMGATFASWPPLQTYWTNFARSGNPNGRGLPLWRGFGKNAAYMDFTPQGPKAGKDLRGEICGLLAP